MHIGQTLGNAKKLIVDYAANRLDAHGQASDAWRARADAYAGYIKHEPVRPDAVLYESNMGRGMVDNPYAIFRAALEDERLSSLQHYWVLDDPSAHPELDAYRALPNVHFVRYEGKRYLYALATCAYLVNNATFPEYFAKRDGQTLLNTWHGTPMKSMGYDMAGGVVASANVVRQFMATDYLLSANDVMTHMYLQSYKMQGILSGAVVEEGYPRTDLALKADAAEVLGRLEAMGVDVDRTKKVILFAPTWRNAGSSNSTIDTVADAGELIAFKSELETRIDTDAYQVLVKPHNFLYDLVKDDESLAGKLVPSCIDANELMAAVDVLVSDFSSIVFDYLVLDRPILFYVPDLETYQSTRGLDWNLGTLPGPCAASIEELAAYVNDLDATWETFAERHRASREAICPYDDGAVSKRICELLFLGGADYRRAAIEQGKRRILINGGSFERYDMAEGLRELLAQIDYDAFDVTVYVIPASPDAADCLPDVPDSVRVLARVGDLVFTEHERASRATYDGFGRYSGLIRRSYPFEAYRREARRCFGCVHFDEVIDYNGCEQILTEIVLAADADRRVLCQHGDLGQVMQRASEAGEPLAWQLHHVISTYPDFDCVAFDSEELRDANRAQFATPETSDRFACIEPAFEALCDASKVRGML